MRQIPIVLILAMLAGCAEPGPDVVASVPPPPECLNLSMVQSFRPMGQNRIRVDAAPRQSFDLELSGPHCDQIEWTQRVLMQSSASSFLCAGASLGQGDVTFRDMATGQGASCHIDAIHPVAEPA